MDFYKILMGGIGVGMSNFDRLFAEKHGGGGIQEITGTLPLTVRSRASQVLENYIIYGESVQDGTPAPDNPVEVTGLGVRTENLFDYTAKNINNGYISRSYININGNIETNYSWNVSEYIEVNPSETYTCAHVSVTTASASVGFYDENKSLVGQSATFNVDSVTTFTTPSTTKYVRISYRTDHQTTAMLTKGSTALETYIPYGYKLPIKVTSNGTTTDYPVYIGDSQLMEGEYVNYEEQKIYKLVDGVLTPTDPPVPLPDISIPEGKITIDIEGELKPQAIIKGLISPTN